MPKPDRRSIQKNPAPALARLLEIMARLRAPDGCPWDREQDHRTLRFHAVEEVYELLDAIDSGNDRDLEEELGDLLLQIVFHAQMAGERGAFDFNQVAQRLVDKLIHRHPHVFGSSSANTAAAVLDQWERLKQAEKEPAPDSPRSALDGIPRHLPALMRAQKLWKKAVHARLADPLESRPAEPDSQSAGRPVTRRSMAIRLFELAALCQAHGWSAEELLRQESQRREKRWRRAERRPRSLPSA